MQILQRFMLNLSSFTKPIPHMSFAGTLWKYFQYNQLSTSLQYFLLHKMQNYDLEIAATIFNEARGESSAGRQAVAATIYNRQKYQCPKCKNNHGLSNWRNKGVFHGYSSSKPNVPQAQKKVWEQCCQFAQGWVNDNTNGATHFQRASYGNDYVNLVKIGAHYFAREKTEITRHR